MDYLKFEFTISQHRHYDLPQKPYFTGVKDLGSSPSQVTKWKH